MCYEERRWHTICNHTIQARLECPRRCTQYAGGIDVVETQLLAYCRACLRHVDSLGVVAALARRPSKRKRDSIRAAPLLLLPHHQKQQQQQQRKPAPTVPLPETPQNRPNTSSTSASASDLHRSLSERSRKAALGMLMSGFAGAQERQETRDELLEGKKDDNQPVVLCPSPQKPLLTLWIPEDFSSQPAGRPGTPSSDDDIFSVISSPSTTIVLDEDEEHEADPGILAAARTPITPWSPPSPTSFSIPGPAIALPPGKAPTARLPLLDLSPRATPTDTARGTGGTRLALSSGSKSLLRRSRSASRLVLGGGTVLFSARPQLVEISSPRRSPARSTSSISITTTTTTTSSSSSSSVAPAPAPAPATKTSGLGLGSSPLSRLLRRTKSSKTLVDAPSSTSEKREAGVTFAARMRMRKTSTTNLFPPPPPPPPPPPSRNRIDIYDPEWLAKHGLKWDAHGLGIVSAAAS